MSHKKETPLAGGVGASVGTLHVTQYNAAPRKHLPKRWGEQCADAEPAVVSPLAGSVVLTDFLPEGYDGTKGDMKFSVRLSESQRRNVVVSMRRLMRTGALSKWLARLGGAPMSPDEFSSLAWTVDDALTQARQAAADREPYQRAQWVRYLASSRSLGDQYV